MKTIAALLAALLLCAAGCTRPYKQDTRDHGNPFDKEGVGKEAAPVSRPPGRK